VSEFRLDDYLEHIYRAAPDACLFVDGLSKDDFLSDKRTQNAVIMSLIIIGEASGKIMDRYQDFADRHAEIPWRVMRGMRNRIAHGYFEVNLDVVWDTVRTALPALLQQLTAARDDVDDGSGDRP
jgi:uncharacterized protein with HEPN domain